MILEEYLEIRPNGKAFKHYKDLGYDVHRNVPIMIKNEDVVEGSVVEEKIFCDCCKKTVTRTHKAIIDTRKAFGMDLCLECSEIKTQEKIKAANLEKYGVEYPMQSKEIKEKAKATTREHYGTDYSFQNKDMNKKAREAFKKKYGEDNPLKVQSIKDKEKQTNLEKYGVENVFQLNEVKEKSKQTIKEKYGVENSSQIEEVKEKKKKTCLENYGVEHPLQSPEILQKVRETLYNNGTTPTSQLQLDLFEMCKELFPDCLMELNAPLKELSLDIKLTTPQGIIIDLEYDGWPWHQDKMKDRRRDEVVKKYGYKIIRVRSGSLLPTKEELKEAFDYVIQDDKVFSRITLKDWREPK